RRPWSYPPSAPVLFRIPQTSAPVVALDADRYSVHWPENSFPQNQVDQVSAGDNCGPAARPGITSFPCWRQNRATTRLWAVVENQFPRKAIYVRRQWPDGF